MLEKRDFNVHEGKWEIFFWAKRDAIIILGCYLAGRNYKSANGKCERQSSMISVYFHIKDQNKSA